MRASERISYHCQHLKTEKAPSLTVRAYRTIKARLIYLEMAPGTQFTESALAHMLRISKTPVRDALTRLRREGLVEASARSGYRVTPVTIKDARDLFAVRLLLEGEAAALAAHHMTNPKDLLVLDRLCRASYRPQEVETVKTYMRKNTEFHTTIARATGNDYLARLLEEVLDHMERLFNIGLTLTNRASEIVHEHTELVQAIVSGDERVAREVALSQIRASQRMVMDALISSPSLLAANVQVGAEAEAKLHDYLRTQRDGRRRPAPKREKRPPAPR